MSVTWFDGVAYTVEIAFASDPLAVTPTWTDVSAYVRTIPVIRHGRTTETGAFSPSTATVVLKNADRRFDPTYTSGPYYPNLLPMKRIRITIEYDSVTYRQFTGFVKAWPQTYEGVLDSSVTLNAVDGTRFLENAVLAASAYESAVLTDSPIRYWTMQEDPTEELHDVVSGASMTVAYGTATQYELAVPIAASKGVAVDLDGSLGASDLMPTSPRTVEFWADIDADIFATAGLVGVIANFEGTGGYIDQVSLLMGNLNPPTLSDVFGLTVSFYNTDDSLIYTEGTGLTVPSGVHHFVVTTSATEIFIYVDGVEVYNDTLDAGTPPAYTTQPGVVVHTVIGGDYVIVEPDPYIAAPVSHVAVYDTELSAARVVEHYLAGLFAFGHPFGERSGERIERVLDEIAWPAAERTIGTGDTVHGQYTPGRQSALAYMRSVEIAEDGLLFLAVDGTVKFIDRQEQWNRTVVATFSDDGTNVDYSEIEVNVNDVETIRTIVQVNYANSGFLEVSANVVEYGPARESLAAPTIDTDGQARALGNYKLRQMKEPRTLIRRLSLKAREDPATMFPVVLGLAIGQLMTVEVRPQSVGDPIELNVVVQGYDHILVNAEWTTNVYLSPAPLTLSEVPYLVMGDATYGVIGAAAGNQIAF